MRLNSRRKGKRGERKGVEVLKKWTGYDFASVPQSGGLRWKSEMSIGDIICTNSLHRFDFSVEIKNYKEINFEHLLMPQVDSVILKEFWPQCLADSVRGKKLPMLMMRYDGIRPADFFFIVIRYSDFKLLKPQLITSKYPYFKMGRLVFMNSNILFKSDYKQIKNITQKIIKRL